MSLTLRRLVAGFSVLAICLFALSASRAPAQENEGQGQNQEPQDQVCRILRIVMASVLQRCGEHLNSFTLSIDEIRYAARGNNQGTFIFGCPIEPMCSDEPQIVGWFMNPGPWQSSGRGEPEVSQILRSRSPAPSFPVCEAFDVVVAGLPGRAVCYQFPDTGMAAVGVVAADDVTGVVLVFEERTTDWAALRAKVVEKLPLFQARRAAGDAGLMRWMMK